MELGKGIDGEVVVDRLREKLRQEIRPNLAETNLYPLDGKVYRYDNPTEPVALEDWEVLQ